MRTIVTGFVALVLVARAATACGSSDDDDAGQDATSDTTTSSDAPTDTATDVKAATDASDGGGDANAGDSSDASGMDVVDASLVMDAMDANADVAPDAVAAEAGGSCIDGGIACTISEPCCMNFASVNYGKCELMTSCK
jgi:hypothetical protein